MPRSSSFTAVVSWKTSTPSRQDRVRPSASGSSLLHGCSCNQKLLNEGQLMAEYFGYIFWSCSAPTKKIRTVVLCFWQETLESLEKCSFHKSWWNGEKTPWSALWKETPDPARYSVNYSRMICACFCDVIMKRFYICQHEGLWVVLQKFSQPVFRIIIGVVAKHGRFGLKKHAKHNPYLIYFHLFEMLQLPYLIARE